MKKTILVYILRRILQSVLALLGLLTIIFFIFRIMPGNPLAVMISEGLLDPIAQAKIRAEFGLDQPIFIQYIRYLHNLLTGNLGMSFFYNRQVSEVISTSIINTLVLILPSMTLAILFGILVGSLIGWHRGNRFELFGVLSTLFIHSLPVFWLSILLLMIFAYSLGWVPTGGMYTTIYSALGIGRFFTKDFLIHYSLPFLTSFLVYFPVPLLLMRNSIIEIMGEDFLEFTKAKGVKNSILIKHAFRNSLLPVVTYIAVMSTYIIEGNVLLEVVFSWPGMGRELVNAVLQRDYPVAQAAFFVMGVVVITMNFFADLLYGYLDPRVKLRGEE